MISRSKSVSRITLLTATAITALSLQVGAAQAIQKNVMFVLDSSNSMWGQVDGTPKIDIAKQALVDLVDKMPQSTKMGLVAYGHRFNHKLNDCHDMELMSPVGHVDNETIHGMLDFVKPNGQTPIANTLMEVGNWLQDNLEDDNTVVLVSDGLESCDGDPCAAAEALNQAGIATSIHVVGFDLNARQRESIQCIADKGNGQYFDAKDNEGLVKAFEQVREVVEAKPIQVAQAKVEPVIATDAVYFEDNFDGDELGSHWTVDKEDPDSYIVEDGKLTVLFGDSGNPTHNQKSATNIFRLNAEIPKGDWTMTMRVLYKAQTHKEWVRMGLIKDDDNSLLTSLQASPYNYAMTQLYARTDKLAKGENTNFFSHLINYDGERNTTTRSENIAQSVQAAELRLTKTGRNYVSAVKLEAPEDAGDKAPIKDWVELQKLTSLKLPGDAFSFFFGHQESGYVPKDGEGLMEVDWIKIEKN